MAELRAIQFHCLPTQRQQFPTVVGVPNADRASHGDRYNPRSIGAERDIRDNVVVANQLAQFLASI